LQGFLEGGVFSLKNLIVLVISILCLQASAQKEPPESPQEYRIEDLALTPLTVRPDQLIKKGIQFLSERVSTRLSLLKWSVETKFESPKEAYNRRLHFGTWIDDPRDQTCHNTRAQVLIRDSETEVSFKPENPCSVSEGTWKDPYSDQVFYTSNEVQVDHFVPLKNAYISGGWTWSSQKRCLYANFMGNNFHLLTVQAHENLSKGDSSPEHYLPPHRAYVCQYLNQWLKVKMIWNLKMSVSEAQAIRLQIREYGCSVEEFTISQKELARQRQATEKLQVLCEL